MSKAKPPITDPSALVQMQAAVKGVEKDGKNDFHRYKYATAEAIIEEAKPALAAAGVVVLPISAEIVRSERGDAATLRRVFRVVVCADLGYDMTLDWPIIPEKGRPWDKAHAGALTSSLAYFLRDLLLMPRVEEGTDMDSGERDRKRQQNTNAPAKSPPRKRTTQAATTPRPSGGKLANRCPECGGDLWDNSAKRADGWKGPAFKCADNGDGCFIQWESAPVPCELPPADLDREPGQMPKAWAAEVAVADANNATGEGDLPF